MAAQAFINVLEAKKIRPPREVADEFQKMIGG